MNRFSFIAALSVLMFLCIESSAQQSPNSLQSKQVSLNQLHAQPEIEISEQDGMTRTHIKAVDGSQKITVHGASSDGHPGVQPDAQTRLLQIEQHLLAIEYKRQTVISDVEMNAQAIEDGWYTQMDEIVAQLESEKQAILDQLSTE